MTETEHDAEIPDASADDGPRASLPDQSAGDTRVAKEDKGKIVDAAAGAQADKPAVKGDPKDGPNHDSGTAPPADFE
jgi:hypothetical protein